MEDHPLQKIRNWSGGVLDLCHYHIGNDELRVVCDKIKHKTSLKKLWLSHNEISDLTPLAEALIYNSSIEVLVLGYNRISDLSSLAEALRYNSSLEMLWLYHNQISVLTPIVEVLRYNTSIEHLDFYGNPISCCSDRKIIEEMVSINRYNTPKRHKTLFEMMLESGILT